MSRKAIRLLTRRHISIYDQDWDFLSTLYGPAGMNPEVGVGPAIREIIHLHVERLRSAQHAAIDHTKGDAA